MLTTRLQVSQKYGDDKNAENIKLVDEIEVQKQQSTLLNDEINTHTFNIARLERKVVRKEKEIEQLNTSLAEKTKALKSANHKVVLRDTNIEKLKFELNEKCKPIKSNAGRKTKITNEVVARVEVLKIDGKSLSGIANILSLEFNENFSKSTIKKIVDTYIKAK